MSKHSAEGGGNHEGVPSPDYDAIERAGFEVHLFCRVCNAILNTGSSVIMGVCTDCIAASKGGSVVMKRPRYGRGRGNGNR